MATFHPTLPRGTRVRTQVRGTLKEILLGPAHENDGRLNFLALCARRWRLWLRDAQGVSKGGDHVGTASLQTEGKALQRSQGVGMGH